MSRDTLKRALGNVFLGAIVLFLLWCYLASAGFMAERPGYGDFRTFHASVRELIQGGDIYARIPIADYLDEDSLPPGTPEFYNPNLNPPFQTVVLFPLGFLDYAHAFMVWTLVGLFCGVAGGILLGFGLAERGKRARSSLVLTIVLLACYPTAMSVLFGQWALLPFLFVVLAWMAWRTGKPGVAGAVLGLLAAIKLFFGAFFLLFLFRREWRAVLTFLASWLLCTVASAVLVGLDTTLDYISIVRGAHWFGSSWNGSFLGFFTRAFGGGETIPLVSAPSLTPLLSYACAALAVSSLLPLRKPAPAGSVDQVRDDLSFVLVVPVMLLVSPFGWMYYFPFLMVPLAVLWKTSAHFRARRILRSLLALAWLLAVIPNPVIRPRDINGDPTQILLRSGVYFYTLLLFWGLAWGTQRALLRKPGPA